LELPRLVKKAMENNVGKRKGWNTHIWIGEHVQVEDGWSRGTCEVLVMGLHMVGRFEYGFVIKAHENSWRKRTEEHLSYFSYFDFISFSFFHFSFFFHLPFFSYFSFLLVIIFLHFFFCSSELLQHNTYVAFVRDDVMNPPSCLNDARPRA
jgi:hypothetical protein